MKYDKNVPYLVWRKRPSGSRGAYADLRGLGGKMVSLKTTDRGIALVKLARLLHLPPGVPPIKVEKALWQLQEAHPQLRGTQPEPDHEEPCSTLRKELAECRRALVSALPEGPRRITREVLRSPGAKGFDQWRNGVVEQVLRLADENKRPLPLNRKNQRRFTARCPLCHRGSRNHPNTWGFALPAGLRRHLLGIHPADECEVMEHLGAAVALKQSERAKLRGGIA